MLKSKNTQMVLVYPQGKIGFIGFNGFAEVYKDGKKVTSSLTTQKNINKIMRGKKLEHGNQLTEKYGKMVLQTID